ncbi:putative RNA helicase [Diachasmimorpha longicaudata entomopoxvirus]|uniref:RNA helicase n=1 Tax=Diachasmimorpha longicaudata entomopoxvirus TaxID=109981 RepID=Q5GF26_9POXV|nr:hypothetical protein FLA14_p101 [Diachasmimorpha longicaudata entomopoxvirus]YP_010796805.1 putative RNA helicase [Diachasmimorpha longicaudata entomopoxvirus]AAT99858.1 unknown [Diachasmimorpha longicaudata entomopoxvirus]AKS26349.1 putative RNA helicase [Diachasmimorpha longicaudata entomopoxvirus]
MNSMYAEFDHMGLKKNILKGIYSCGFEKPSTIQQKAIFPCISGKDVIVQAQSGTGKTATYAISVLQQIDTSNSNIQALILTPTRELALQAQRVLQTIGNYLYNFKCQVCIGGTSIKESQETLKKAQVLIGTPGRMIDLLTRKSIDTKAIKIVVIDEADEMLIDNFLDKIQDIFEFFESHVQVILLSATVPSRVINTSQVFMRDPVKILVKNAELTLEGIRQYYINVKKNDFKAETLFDLYDHLSLTQTLIFCNTRRQVDVLMECLTNRNFTASSIHGDMSQQERDFIMKEFRDGKTRILLSTNLLARGIDVQQISLVINYDLPHNRENYIHRIGRSGRFGRKGIAINFITEDELPKLAELETFYNTKIDEMPENIVDLI